MEIFSSRFGKLDIEEPKIVEFPEGIPGFQDFKRYIILKKEDNNMFYFLHSVENKDLMFILTNPYYFILDYYVKISNEDCELLQIDRNKTGIIVLVIVKIDKDKKIYLNLKAPICLNFQKKIGKQIILYDSDYSHQFLLNSENILKSVNLKQEFEDIDDSCATII